MAQTIPLYNTLGLGRKEQCDRPRRGQPFCQLVSREDVTMFQVPNICDGEYEITNSNTEFDLSVAVDYGQFDSGGKNVWTDNSGSIKTSGESRTLYSTNTPYELGDQVQLDIDITLCPGVIAEVVFISGGAVDMLSTITVVQVISVSGTYSISHTNAFAIGRFGIRIVGTCTEGNYTVLEYYRSKKLVPSICYNLYIKDINGDTVAESTDYDLFEDYTRWRIDWNTLALPDGCYTVCVENAAELTEGALCSECFTLKETHPCTLKLEWWNDNDAYGYYYDETDFKHSMRVAGSLAKPSFAGEKETFTDTEGEQIIVYADKKKVQELAINDIPEYMHEALAIGIDHDHFTINGDEYIIEESSYEPQWRKTSDLAPVVLDVRPKIQNLKNSYC